VCEPNETGKSTILEALRAVLFERHGSKSDRIHSFRPHGDDVAPEVDLVFEVSGGAWKVRKRFLQKPEILLEGPGVRATGDEAEERLQSLLGFARAGNRGADPDTRGALGLLWVEQGASFVLGAPGQAARRTLEEVLAGEVGAVTGGRRTAAVIQAVEKALADLLTGTGRPTRRLLEAQQTAEAAQAEAAAARQELSDFEAVLERLESKRNEHRRLIRDLEDPEQDEQLAALARDIERARAAAQLLRTADLVLKDASAARGGLEARATTRASLRRLLQQADGDLQAARETAAKQVQDLAEARDRERAAAVALESARETLRGAEEAMKTASAERAARARRHALKAAFARLDAAEAIAADLVTARQAILDAGVTEEDIERLEELERALTEARTMSLAGAASITVALEPGAPEARLNGTRVEDGHCARVTEPQVLELAGIGAVRVDPPLGGETAQATLRAAEQDLTAFLAAKGYDAPAKVRAAARARAQAAQVASTLAARLEATCTGDQALAVGPGLEALRGVLALEQRPAAVDGGEAAADVDAERSVAWEAARETAREAEGRREAAVDSLREAEREEVRQTGLVERAVAERQRLSDELDADVASLADDALDGQLSEARAEEARALVSRDEARRATEGLDETVLTHRRDALQQRRDRMRDDRLGLVQEIAKLEERAKTLGASGPASRLAAAEEMADAARVAYERQREEAEVLSLLDRVIKDAQLEASRRYLAPITKRVAPYVTRLLPNASLAFSEDYTPELLIRGGREEAAEHLSKGTQEQLAVLTRIAFADLLIEKGKPASLVLDDALVFADDDRFETMLEILSEAARRMQVIVLSCRTSAYRSLNANRLTLG
jgi:DNA repair exonuclease SbcCD ATPase subunit